MRRERKMVALREIKVIDERKGIEINKFFEHIQGFYYNHETKKLINEKTLRRKLNEYERKGLRIIIDTIFI
jgi:hypothetical protein